ncbi:MAG TPA: FUSC family protein [Acetobacteraceae bacterium]|nr:FUSC family protein [Acetobacteraceae bacterium]
MSRPAAAWPAPRGSGGVAPRIRREFSRIDGPQLRRLLAAVRASGPALRFGLRLWASVCLALLVAFWLQLQDPSWAGTSAALVCQPQLGASLRKGWFRMIGTAVGAVVIVLLSAWFPQDRGAFLAGLALWGAACTLVGTVLRNFAAYAAALAGYTAAIVASDTLGATGGTDGQAFMLATFRVTEICVGIVSAGVVLAGTDFGGARRRLAELLAALVAEITTRFIDTLGPEAGAAAQSRTERRALIGRVIALDPVIDQAIGESATIRYHSPVLTSAADGLFAALSGWRTVATRLARLPEDEARQEAAALVQSVPPELRAGPGAGEPTRWKDDPVPLLRACGAAVSRLIAAPALTPSRRMLLDETAKLLAGVSHGLEALALLADAPGCPRSRDRGRRLRVPDWLPAWVNAVRSFLAIGTMELFWVLSGWPNGAVAVTFTAITVILMALQQDQAYARAVDFSVGTGLAAVFAGIVLFAALPAVESFVGFSIVLGLYLLPAGALAAQPWRAGLFAPMVGNFIPLLAPANPMNYDTAQFYNSAVAIVAGCGAGALWFRLLPPLSPAFRTRRLLRLTLHDLRLLAHAPSRRTEDEWEEDVYARLAALPDQAEPWRRAQLLAALGVGTALIRLHRVVARLGLGPELEPMLQALVRGDSAAAVASLARIDRLLTADAVPAAPLALRGRASLLAMSEALSEHGAYFGAPA